MEQTEEMPVALSWHQALRKAEQHKYETKVKLPKSVAGPLPHQFEESPWSIEGRAKAAYRDQRETDSFQVREYEDYWTVEMDQFNPEEGRAVEHVVADAPGYTAAALVGIAALGAALGS